MKNLLLNNYKIKIVSVLLAAGLWWFVYASQNPRIGTSFPVVIQYQNLAPEFKLASNTKTVRVELRGDQRLLENVGPENLQAIADLEGLGEGAHRVEFKVVNRTGLRMSTRTSSVDVQLTPLKKIELPVDLRVKGALKENYTLGQVTYKPMSASVYGEDSDLKLVARIIAAADISGRKKDFRVRVPLRVLDGSGADIPGIHVSPATVLVTAAVNGQIGKTAPVSVTFKNPDLKSKYPNTDFYPQVISLSGDPDTLKSLNDVKTEEFDLSQCDAGGSYPLKLKLPDGVSANAEQVTYYCEPQKSISRTLTVTLHAINLCASCGAGLQPTEIKVTVTGIPDAVNGLNPSDLIGNVDLLGMKPGNHDVVPNVHLNKESEQIKLDYPKSPVKAVINK